MIEGRGGPLKLLNELFAKNFAARDGVGKDSLYILGKSA